MAGFFEAASHFDESPARLRSILSHGRLLSRSDGDGLTLLHYAAREGHAQAVALLVQAGVSLELQDRDGRTALHLACLMCGQGRTRGSDHPAIVSILQQNHAMTSTQDNYGRRPLSYLPPEQKAVGIQTKSVAAPGGRWEVQEVVKGSAVLKGSVAVAASLV
ncbi:MAG: hypothetical protein SGPRY_002893 [Prymnesium sp.]